MKKFESQLIHFHPFSASAEAKRKEVSLFVYILAILKNNLAIQLEKKCEAPVEIGLRTLYRDLADASQDADLREMIKNANPTKNPVLKKILGSVEAQLDKYTPKHSVSNDENKDTKRPQFKFFKRQPLEPLSENLLDQQQETEESDSKNKSQYTPPAVK